MKKRTHFTDYRGDGWPDENWLGRYFLTPQGRRDFFYFDNDSWGLKADGVDGTDNMPSQKGRIDVDLTIQGHREAGILLFYHKTGAGRLAYYSRGDLSRLHEWVRTAHGDLMPIGLFIPFETAWRAVKEFMQRAAALPSSIPWVAERDLPEDAFPPPWAKVQTK